MFLDAPDEVLGRARGLRPPGREAAARRLEAGRRIDAWVEAPPPPDLGAAGRAAAAARSGPRSPGALRPGQRGELRRRHRRADRVGAGARRRPEPDGEDRRLPGGGAAHPDPPVARPARGPGVLRRLHRLPRDAPPGGPGARGNAAAGSSTARSSGGASARTPTSRARSPGSGSTSGSSSRRRPERPGMSGASRRRPPPSPPAASPGAGPPTRRSSPASGSRGCSRSTRTTSPSCSRRTSRRGSSCGGGLRWTPTRWGSIGAGSRRGAASGAATRRAVSDVEVTPDGEGAPGSPSASRRGRRSASAR